MFAKALIFSFALSSLLGSGSEDRGRPQTFEESKGYKRAAEFLRVGKGKYRVRVTNTEHPNGAEKLRRMNGKICAKGGETISFNRDDDGLGLENVDLVILDNKKRCLEFDFQIGKHTDGFHFHSKAKRFTYKFEIQGHDLPVARIWISGEHPKCNPGVLRANGSVKCPSDG